MEAYDWDISKLGKPLPPIKFINMADTIVIRENETWKERTLRMLNPLHDVVIQCGMCELGRKMCTEQDTTFDPHVMSNMSPSKWVIVGQNPGFNECIEHEPFVGEAGKFFNKAIINGGMERNDFYITNTVLCHTLGNEKPTNDHTRCCEPFLRIQLRLLKPILVITLGQVAFDVFCPDKTMSHHLGEIVRSPKFDVDIYPVYHPSPRNMNNKDRCDKFQEDISNLCELIKSYRSTNQAQ